MAPAPRYIPSEAEVAQGRRLWARHEQYIEAFVRNRTLRIWHRWGEANTPYDELLQAGRLGAWMGCCRFDAHKAKRRRAKAVPYICQTAFGEMQHYLRDRAAERGCPGWLFAQGRLPEVYVETGMDEALERDRSAELRDLRPEAEFASVEDAEYMAEFRRALSPRLQATYDAVIAAADHNGTGGARTLGVATATYTRMRAMLQRRWRAWEAAT